MFELMVHNSDMIDMGRVFQLLSRDLSLVGKSRVELMVLHRD